MTMQEWLNRYPAVSRTVSVKARLAALYLESHGQRFLCEFGIANAEDMARILKRERRSKAARKAIAKRKAFTSSTE